MNFSCLVVFLTVLPFRQDHDVTVNPHGKNTLNIHLYLSYRSHF